MKKIFKLFILGFATISFVLAYFGYSIYSDGKGEYTEPIESNSLETLTLEVESGDTFRTVLDKLSEKELIENPDYIYLYVKIFGDTPGKLKFGSYEIQKRLSVKEIFERIESGEIKSDTYRITIPEGYTSRQIGIILENYGFSRQEFITETETNFVNYKSKFGFFESSFPEANSIEGFLFPDTYEFSKNSTMEEIISLMLINFERKGLPFFEGFESSEISELVDTKYDALNFASIVQFETGRVEDTGKISSVFANRLEIGMLLQSDATFFYAFPEKTPPMTYADIESDSRYNTYKFYGLPPTPISNPGADTLKKSLNPDETDLLFFFATPDGVTHFSKTLAEHNQKRYELGV